LGHVPLTALDDLTRISREYEFGTWDSIAQFIRDETDGFLSGYQRHRLEGQRNHVELLIEKNTLLNIVTPVADRFMLCHYNVNRGYGNPSFMAENGITVGQERSRSVYPADNKRPRSRRL